MIPCRKCGMTDRYFRGKHSACRPCHNEACKRYLQRKALGETVEVRKPPTIKLTETQLRRHPGREKLFCKNNHPLTGDNVRISSQRNGTNLFRRCRTCERNAARVKYGLPVEPTPSRLSDLLSEG